LKLQKLLAPSHAGNALAHVQHSPDISLSDGNPPAKQRALKVAFYYNDFGGDALVPL
jgi:hypothetical protein